MATIRWRKIWTINPDIAGAPERPASQFRFHYCHIGTAFSCGAFLSAAKKWTVIDVQGRATPIPMAPLCYWKGALLYHDHRTLVRYHGDQRNSLNLEDYLNREHGINCYGPILRAIPLLEDVVGIIFTDYFVLVKEDGDGVMKAVASWACFISSLECAPFGKGFVAAEGREVSYWPDPRRRERVILRQDTLVSYSKKNPSFRFPRNVQIFADERMCTVYEGELWEHAEEGANIFSCPPEISRAHFYQVGNCHGHALLSCMWSLPDILCCSWLYMGSGRFEKGPDHRGFWAADGNRAYVYDGELTCYEALETPATLLDLCARAVPHDYPHLACLPDELKTRVLNYRPLRRSFIHLNEPKA